MNLFAMQAFSSRPFCMIYREIIFHAAMMPISVGWWMLAQLEGRLKTKICSWKSWISIPCGPQLSMISADFFDVVRLTNGTMEQRRQWTTFWRWLYLAMHFSVESKEQWLVNSKATWVFCLTNNSHWDLKTFRICAHRLWSRLLLSLLLCLELT